MDDDHIAGAGPWGAEPSDAASEPTPGPTPGPASGRAPPAPATGPSRGRRRRPGTERAPTRRQVVAIAGSSLAVLLVAAGVGGWGIYHKLDSNITTVDIGGRPSSSGSGDSDGTPMNVLLIGSDTRAGANSHYGSSTGARSDTTMLLHVSADRKSATVASIPRDTMVQLPSCLQPDGTSSIPTLGMFNSAYTVGGPACTVKTVESLTDIPIDHVLVVDFTGFKEIVDAIGGVPVTLDKPVNDPDSHLDLPAGTTVVTGEQALAFVRARHNLGDGSDIGRMGRQQQFLNDALTTMENNGTLDDPAKLYRVLDAATRALTTDTALGSLTALAGFADDVKRVPRSNITYLTVPWQWYPADPNRVQFAPAAQELFDDLRNDRAVPATITALPSGEQKSPTGATSGPSGTTRGGGESGANDAAGNGTGAGTGNGTG